MTKEEYKDISPYDDEEVKDVMESLAKDPGFKNAVNFALPGVDYKAFCDNMLSIRTKDDFQMNVIVPFFRALLVKSTRGCTIDGLENCDVDAHYTYISNHRNIILDAALLFLSMLDNGYRSGQIALGDNLLIYEWIERLVKMNKGFIVKRSLGKIEGYKASKHLSSYIRYCELEKGDSIWIAQREGRAKDSNDRTQESVVKMLALGGNGDMIDDLLDLNIAPVAISYEYDPTDYLKATEFLLKRRDPNHSKCQKDDLRNMETGMLGYKGEIHYHICPVINPLLESLRAITDRNELAASICAAIDQQIYLGYKIYHTMYISYDLLNETSRFADKYTSEQVAAFDKYLGEQLDKVKVEDVTDEERQYMRRIILGIYANPLINKLTAQGEEA